MKRLKRQLILKARLLKKYPKIVAGFTTKLMGDMRKLGGSRKLGEKLNFPFENFCLMRQIHGNVVTTIGNPGTVNGVDGILTQKRGLLCLTRVADCLPILFYEPKKNIIGVCHAGRVGTELEIVKGMVKKIVSLGGEKENLLVTIGPHIHKCCYPVDLTKENKEQLLKSGVKLKNIEIFKECTCCGKNFFSYRKEGKKFREFCGFIGMKYD